MRLRIASHDQLDLPLAWRRTLHWAQQGQLDVRDRLPFELLARLFGDEGPPIPTRPRELFPVTVVAGSKKSGTSRPFSRISATDLVIYQALVDRLAIDVEAALPPRDVVFTYRQSLEAGADAFAGTPNRDEYERTTRDILESFDHGFGFALTTDIAGYFLHVNIGKLRTQLDEISAQRTVVRDLCAVLNAWQSLGIRGLPQRVRPSSPLGNVYLLPIDRLLERNGIRYVRWVDDFIIAAPNVHAARRLQDEIERNLYDLGLSLAADKTRIVPWDTAISESESGKTRLDRMRRQRRAEAEAWISQALHWTDYPPSEDELPNPDDIDQRAVLEEYDRVLDSLDDHEGAKGLRRAIVPILHSLESMRTAHRLDDLPRLLTESPNLTQDVVRYVAAMAKQEPAGATRVLASCCRSITSCATSKNSQCAKQSSSSRSAAPPRWSTHLRNGFARTCIHS